MLSSIVLSSIIVQTGIALYLLNALKKEDFERKLNAILIILIFHLGTKFFILTVLKNPFLYTNNATGFGLSYGPLLYITARSYIKQPLGMRAVLLHMLPFSLFTLAYFVNGACYILNIGSGNFVGLYTAGYQWLATASLVVYPVITVRLLTGHTKEKFDDRAGLIRSIAYIMITGVGVGLAVAIIHFIKTGNADFDLRLIPYICMAGLPVLILRYKMKPVAAVTAFIPQYNEQNDIIIVPSKQSGRQYKKSALDIQMMDEYEVTLKKFMEKSKIYLETEISLDTLSSKVNIPKHHLTQLLNEKLKKNFYVFINEYRINEAIKKLKNPDREENILSLAYDCGFNSKSSFNNYFKKITGLTPSTYRKNHLERLAEEGQLTE